MNWFCFKMYYIDLDLYWIQLASIWLIDFIAFGIVFFGFVVFMTSFKFLDVVSVLYKHVRFYQFHQIPLLCDHQELACTPKDPPWRVDIKNESDFFDKKTMTALASRKKKHIRNFELTCIRICWVSTINIWLWYIFLNFYVNNCVFGFC